MTLCYILLYFWLLVLVIARNVDECQLIQETEAYVPRRSPVIGLGGVMVAFAAVISPESITSTYCKDYSGLWDVSVETGAEIAR